MKTTLSPYNIPWNSFSAFENTFDGVPEKYNETCTKTSFFNKLYQKMRKWFES